MRVKCRSSHRVPRNRCIQHDTFCCNVPVGPVPRYRYQVLLRVVSVAKNICGKKGSMERNKTFLRFCDCEYLCERRALGQSGHFAVKIMGACHLELCGGERCQGWRFKGGRGLTTAREHGRNSASQAALRYGADRGPQDAPREEICRRIAAKGCGSSSPFRAFPGHCVRVPALWFGCECEPS